MNKNEKLLASFTKYCKENPDMRFWQALRNWCGEAFILAGNCGWIHQVDKDTFYWEGRHGQEFREEDL